MLAIHGLHKSFPTPTGPLVVLNDISLELAVGASVAITGPSGSGKSTLLQIIGTLDEPTAGTITLHGVNPFALSPDALARFRNQQIGFIFQDHYLLPQLNVWQNMLVPLLAGQSPATPELLERAHRLLQRVGLSDRLDHRPGELSGGQRQRVAIARALLLKPTLILADEPTGNLDAENGKIVSDILLQLLADEPAILIAVTHSRELAAHMATELRLIGGRIDATHQ